jgi:hypothetical protein
MTWLEIASVAGSVVVFCAIAYWLYGTLTDAKRSAAAVSPGEPQHRLLQPDYEGVRGYFNVKLPDELVWLYSRSDLLTKKRFVVTSDRGESHTIDHFLPLAVDSVQNTWYPVGQRQVPIAIDQAGNYLVVSVDGDAGDLPVFYVDHDGGAVWQVAASLRALFERSSGAQP